MIVGIAIVKDGNQGAGLSWNVYAVSEDGGKTLLSPTWTREVKEPQVVTVERVNKQTRKMQKEKRHVDVVVGTTRVTGESQTQALARATKELIKMITTQNKVRGVLLPAVGP